jgi:fructose-bisphosphate aldolase class I
MDIAPHLIAPSLRQTALALVGTGKGLLAMDESTSTCDKRFAAAGIEQTQAARYAYRELLVTTPGLATCVSGAILCDETIRQRNVDGARIVDRLVAAGIMPGIKVDRGAKPLALHAGETVTEGLDGLADRLTEYAALGATFAKWRGVIRIAGALPSTACIRANAQALARYAAVCQQAGLVPIVEPEVLMEGDHGIDRCAAVTQAVLLAVFDEVRNQDVDLEALILKPNMVLPGLDCPLQVTAPQAAAATLRCLLHAVPACVAGVAFLSGGQSPALATARLNALNLCGTSPGRGAPWPLVFSFARAIQQPALELWQGQEANRAAAQNALRHRAECNRAALRGAYTAATQRPAVDRLAS